VRAELEPGIAKPKSDKQRKMLDVIRRWEETYNNNVEKMTLETYGPDAEVVFSGASAICYAPVAAAFVMVAAIREGYRWKLQRF